MKHAFYLLLLALSLGAALPLEARKSAAPIKVGTYNLCTSDSRKKVIKRDSTVSTQRYWCHSAIAVAKMIEKLDCDIIGFQEVCDSIWGVKGENGIQGLVKTPYEWVLFPNSSHGHISYDTAIAYKPKRFKCLGSGIFWTGGYPTEPKSDRRGAARPCTWLLLKDRQSGKKFYFLSVHLHFRQHNLFNAENFANYAENELIPKKVPSLLVGDMNCVSTSKAFRTHLITKRWKDAFSQLKSAGELPEEEIIGSMNAKNESSIGTGRLDHILYDGFTVSEIHTDRGKFPTTDGSLHYPSDHLPVTCIVRFK